MSGGGSGAGLRSTSSLSSLTLAYQSSMSANARVRRVGRPWPSTRCNHSFAGPFYASAARPYALLFGGYTGRTWKNDAWLCSPLDGEFCELEWRGDRPSPRGGASMVVLNPREAVLFLCLGYDGITYVQDFYFLKVHVDERVVESRQVCFDGAPPTGRSSQTAVAVPLPLPLPPLEPPTEAPSSSSSPPPPPLLASSSALLSFSSSATTLSSQQTRSTSSAAAATSSSPPPPPTLPPQPPPLVESSLVFVFGGFDGHARLDDAYLLDCDKLEARALELLGDVPSARGGHVSVLIDDRRVFVWGGISNMRQACSPEAYLIDTRTLKCDEVQLQGRSPPPLGYAFAAACMVGRHTLLLHGGADPTASFNTEAYFVDTETWHCWNVPAGPEAELPEPRSDHSLVPVDELSAFMFGGFGGQDTRFSDIFVFENTSMEKELRDIAAAMALFDGAGAGGGGGASTAAASSSSSSSSSSSIAALGPVALRAFEEGSGRLPSLPLLVLGIAYENAALMWRRMRRRRP